MIRDRITFALKLESWAIDFLVVFIFSIPLVLVYFIFEHLYYAVFMISFIYCIVICKDLIYGQSFGKYKYKLLIVDMNGNTPSLFKLIIRNIIFILIWPLEIIINMIHPERRLGDLICGTQLVISNEKIFDRKSIFKGNLIWIFLIILLLFFSFSSVIVGIVYSKSNILQLFYS